MLSTPGSTLQETYTLMWQNAMQRYQNDQFEYDPYLNGRKDTRRGITLLARPNIETRQNIIQFLNEFAALEPEQYCHPESDLHMTIMSIVACREGYILTDEQQYCAAIASILTDVSAFDVEFSGITASPNCVLIQGFTFDNSLQQLRNSIRQEFSHNTLEHTMDTRYTIKTAHSSVVRYRTAPASRIKLIDFLQSNKQRFFGKCKITELELVLNDWYQRQMNTRVLARYELNK